MMDKLLILYTVTEEDVDKLAVSLKTLEFFPPTIDYEVIVISDDTSHDRLQGLVEASQGVSLHKWPGTLAEAVDTAWKASDANFVMLLHSDALFLNGMWCDVLLSKMIERSIQVMGSNAFQEFNNLYGGRIKTIPSHVIIFTREALNAIGGFEKKIEGEVRGPLVHFHSANHQIQVAGADLSSFMRHLSICAYDSRTISEDQIRSIQEEILRKLERVK
jgi:glycosyltransferase involved in cell wall biosynthesis